MSPSAHIVEVETLANAQSPESAFAEYVTKYQALKDTAETLTVTDEADKAGMKLARETRLTLRDIRIDAEKTRKALKEESLKRGQRIDAAAKKVTSIIEPLEDRLLEQEEFAERAAEARQKRLQADREAAMRPYDSIGGRDYADFSEQDFQRLLADAKELHEGRLAREKAAQEAAAAEEARRLTEQAAIRAENDRLRAEQQKLQAEHSIVMERERAARAAEAATAAAAAKAERDAREIAEAKVRGLEAEAANRKEAEAIQAARAAAGPDREKILSYCEALRAVPPPVLAVPLPAIAALIQNLCVQLAGLLDAPAENGGAGDNDY